MEQHVRMTNLSEGGMAIHTVKPLRHAQMVHFAIEFPMGVSITGKGQVAWINAEGMAGIALQTLDGKGKEYLEGWLMAQEQLAWKRTS